jgi:hypothetical protein
MSNRSVIALVAAAAMVIAASIGAAIAALPAGNELKNAGAETIGGRYANGEAKPAGWETAGINPDGTEGNGVTVVQYNPSESYLKKEQAAAIGGGRKHFSGGGAVATATQTIDVARAGSEIDGGGVKVCVSAYLGGVGTIPDGARVDVEFLNADDSRLGTLRIGPVTPAQRKNENAMLRRAAQRSVPQNTRQLRVVLTAEHFIGAATKPSARRGGVSYAYADNVSVALTKGNCDPVLSVKCVKKALVATVTPSDTAKTQRVRFSVKGGKRTKQVQDARAPYTGRFTMDGFSGRLKVTATVQQAGSGAIALTKASKRC